MGATIKNYHIYSDETFLHGKVAFAIGGLICTPRRSEIIDSKIKEIRQKYHFFGEIKWNKLNKDNYPLYKELADLFFDDKYARFSVMKVIKGQDWNKWGPSEEERFFKTYYVFLKLNTSPFSRYYVFVDEKPRRRNSRWDSLHYLFNRSRGESWPLKHRNIKILMECDSRKKDLLQLTDLLLGSTTSLALSEVKSDFKTLIDQKLLSKTSSGKFKIEINEWTPYKGVKLEGRLVKRRITTGLHKGAIGGT